MVIGTLISPPDFDIQVFALQSPTPFGWKMKIYIALTVQHFCPFVKLSFCWELHFSSFFKAMTLFRQFLIKMPAGFVKYIKLFGTLLDSSRKNEHNKGNLVHCCKRKESVEDETISAPCRRFALHDGDGLCRPAAAGGDQRQTDPDHSGRPDDRN
jgi:hypothetical protein